LTSDEFSDQHFNHDLKYRARRGTEEALYRVHTDIQTYMKPDVDALEGRPLNNLCDLILYNRGILLVVTCEYLTPYTIDRRRR
jgi:hypothetical protein